MQAAAEKQLKESVQLDKSITFTYNRHGFCNVDRPQPKLACTLYY